MTSQGTLFYSEVFAMLDQQGIRSTRDVNSLRPDYSNKGCLYLTSYTFPWVADVYSLVHAGLKGRVHEIQQGKGHRILYDPPYSAWWFNDWTPTDEVFRMRGAYACLFPGRVTFRSAPFRDSEFLGMPRNVYMVPLDFLIQAVILRSALTRGLAELLPTSIRYEEDVESIGVLRHNIVDSRALDVAPSFIRVEGSGAGWERLRKATESDGGDAVERQFLRTPWLFGVDIDAFVRLMDDDESFFLYDRAVARLISPSSPGDSDTLLTALDDLAAATSRLHRTFRKQQRAISWKSGATGLGSIVTVASFLGPSSLKAVAAGVGSASLVQAGLAIRDYVAARRDLSDSDYWLLWGSMRNNK
ncbi:hypothetical protein ACWCO3_28595 [Micromonospora sp. NPDC002411]